VKSIKYAVIAFALVEAAAIAIAIIKSVKGG
jgi:hypothetical protein